MDGGVASGLSETTPPDASSGTDATEADAGPQLGACRASCEEAGEPICKGICLDACASGRCTLSVFHFEGVKHVACGEAGGEHAVTAAQAKRTTMKRTVRVAMSMDSSRCAWSIAAGCCSG